MRILFDSRQLCYKTPFGTLIPGEDCTLHIHIPTAVHAQAVCVCLLTQAGEPFREIPLSYDRVDGAYTVFRGCFSLSHCGLFFYFFRIATPDNSFRLYKQGEDTNMEAGDCWQLSCIPADFTTPSWAQGAVFYQVFPDRFCRSGSVDLSTKLTPYTCHENWREEVVWQPDSLGIIQNNDFYGGNFRGISEKLPYLASLGVTALYLNPICKAHSNHRYDTADYRCPDPMLGTEDDFSALCHAAHLQGIRILLDGVFSHTGANSRYFDREGSFGGGACSDPDSPYRSWYTFYRYPDKYESWWGFSTLPTVNKADPGFRDFIYGAVDSVVAYWMALGADGFRLDVADELPDDFIAGLRKCIRRISPEALLIGEVWEDASHKISYGTRRRYFVDGELDSCMNYPLRTAILDFMTQKDSGIRLRDTVLTLAENYPPQVLACNLNLLGSHDTPRILTALVDDFTGSREDCAARRLSPEMRELARERLQMASFLQYTLPGAPCLYYGDEAGMEGYADPFNRRTYPWGEEDSLLLAHYRRLGQLRRNTPALARGTVSFFHAEGGRLGILRETETHSLRIYVNRSIEDWDIPAQPLLLGHRLHTVAPHWYTLAPMGWCILQIEKED